MTNILDLLKNLKQTIEDIKAHPSFDTLAEDVMKDLNTITQVVNIVHTNPIGLVIETLESLANKTGAATSTTDAATTTNVTTE